MSLENVKTGDVLFNVYEKSKCKVLEVFPYIIGISCLNEFNRFGGFLTREELERLGFEIEQQEENI